MLNRLLIITLLASPSLMAQRSDAVSLAVEAINERRFSEAVDYLQKAIAAAHRIADEEQRNAALAALHFHSAVAHLELNDDDSARESLTEYVRLRKAGERFDESKYSRRFVELYRDVVERPSATAAGVPFDRVYPSPASVTDGFVRTAVREWDRSPEYALLATAGDKNVWNTLVGDAAREQFVVNFWSDRDLSPETPRNEFREEFERRVAYADRVFASSHRRGSLTDRGRVYVLLGPPDMIDVVQESVSSRSAPTLLSAPAENQSKLARAQSRRLEHQEPRQVEAERWSYTPSRVPVNVPSSGISYTFVREDAQEFVLEKEFFANKALRDVALLKKRR